MRLRSALLVAVAVLIAAVWALLPVGGTASAVGTCSVVAPTKVVLDRPVVEVPFTLGSDCAVAGTSYASWDVIHPSEGPVGGVTFGGTDTDAWDLADWMGPGRYTVRPWSALDVTDDLLVQNTAATTVKLGSRLTATTSRTPGRLTFDAVARTYSPALSDWAVRAGAKVSVMHLAPGSSTWTWLKAADTGSTGRVSLAVVPKDGSYRLTVKETPSVWAGWSPTVRGA